MKSNNEEKQSIEYSIETYSIIASYVERIERDHVCVCVKNLTIARKSIMPDAVSKCELQLKCFV